MLLGYVTVTLPQYKTCESDKMIPYFQSFWVMDNKTERL